jgi:tetratricopeptide (TPR) repeat protein
MNQRHLNCILLMGALLAAPICAWGELSGEDRARFGMAQSMNNSQRFRQAIPILKSLHETYSNDDSVAIEYAKALGYGGDPEKAIPLLKKLMAGDPENTYMQKTLASVYETGKKPKEARALYLRLLDKNPDSLEYVRKIAHLSVWLEDQDSAEKYYRKALKMKEDAPLRAALVKSLLKQGDIASARIEASGTAADQMRDDSLLAAAGEAQARADWKAAEGIYTELVSRKPEERAFQLELAKMMGLRGKVGKAVVLLEELIEENPDDTVVRHIAAAMYESAGMPEKAQAEYELLLEKNPEDSELKVKVADSAAWAEDYDKAETFYRKAILDHPKTLALKQKLIHVLYSSGKDEAARKELAELSKSGPVGTERMMEIAGTLLGRLEFKRALRIYEDVLSVEPDNRMAALWIARVISWKKDYRAALEKYDELIAKHDDWPVPAREKGRVLGWARRYRASLEQLDIAAKAFPDSPGIALEREAKASYYDMHYIRALEAYDKWLAVEPEDFEALFEYAQIRSTRKEWSHAFVAYRMILEQEPSHFRAEQAAAKVEFESKHPRLNIAIEAVDAESESRDVDRDSLSADTSLSVPILQHVLIGGGYGYSHFSFEDSTSLDHEVTFVTGALQNLPLDTEVRGRIGRGELEGSDDSETLGHAEISTHPVDLVSLTAGWSSDRVVDNSQVIESELLKDAYALRIDLLPTRSLSLGADVEDAYLSDYNDRFEWGVDFVWHALHGRRDLSLAFRHEEYEYDQQSPLYFSPDSFYSDQLSLQWQHFFGKTELFWGSASRFYVLRYTYTVDSNEEVGHGFHAGVDWNWNARFHTTLSWSGTSYEDSSVYEDNRIGLHARLFF